MKKFEYKEVDYKQALFEYMTTLVLLTELGNEGWELVWRKD